MAELLHRFSAGMAAVQIELEGRVEAPLGRTWALLADRAAAPEWLEGVEAALGDGARLILRRSPRGGVAGGAGRAGRDRGGSGREWIEATVQEAVPRELLSLTLERPSALLGWAEVRVRLRPDEGGTAFALRVVGLPTALGALFRPLLRLRLQVALRGALRGFRSVLAARERRSRPAAEGSGAARPAVPGVGRRRRPGPSAGALASGACV